MIASPAWAADTGAPTVVVSITVEVTPPPDGPRNVFIAGFTDVDARTQRPVRDARPTDFGRLQIAVPTFPLQVQRNLRTDLHYFVLIGTGTDPSPQDQMSAPVRVDRTGDARFVIGTVHARAPPAPSGAMGIGGLLVLALVPLGCRLLLGRNADRGRPLRVQPITALLIGIVFASACEFWLVRHHLDGPLTATDFLDFCNGVVGAVSGRPEMMPASRSMLAATLPAWFAGELGIIDALRATSLLSTVLIGAAIFTWARVLGGTTAGLAAVAAAATMGPLTHTPRMISFYPEMTATFVVGAALTALVIRSPRISTAVLAGLAIAACALIDARGVVFAGGFAVGASIGVVVRATEQRRWTLCALWLPILLSWPAGRWAHPTDGLSLADQADTARLVEVLETQPDGVVPDPPPPTARSATERFVWGRTPLLALVPTLLDLARTDRAIPASLERADARRDFTAHIRPWMPLLLIGLPLALVGSSRRPGGAWALIVGLAPFAVGLHAVLALAHAEVPARFYGQLMPAFAVCLGLAFAMLYRAVPGRRGWPRPVGPWVRRSAVVAVLAGLVIGWIPTSLAVDAQWRSTWPAITAQLAPIRAAVSEPSAALPPRAEPCVQALRAE